MSYFSISKVIEGDTNVLLFGGIELQWNLNLMLWKISHLGRLDNH